MFPEVMPNLLKIDDFLVKVVAKNRFFRTTLGRINKEFKRLLATLGGQHEEGKISAFFAQRNQVVGDLPKIRLYWTLDPKVVQN